jgi:serine/threonine protein kinase
MALSAPEQAFAEAILVEGIVPGTKLAIALKLKEAQKKNLPQVLVDLRLVVPDEAKRLWKVAEAGLKASPAPAFSFSEGAMMGPYELVEPRGQFLAGTHWRAKRPEGMGLLRLVPPGTGLDQDRAQRLIDRANAGVDPPDASILKVDDAGEEFNWLYIGTLGFDGKSLASRLQKGPLSEPEALTLARTVAKALSVAHGFGVVHAGLSTLAVVYGPDGAPKLTDFGVGSVFFDGPPGGMPPGLRLGLMLYAAPELLRGGADAGLDARADLYALGALLLDAASAIGPGAVRASENDPWLIQPTLSDGFVTVLRRLLAAELDGRYPSANALLEDLGRLASGGLPGPLPPPGAPLVVAQRPASARPAAVVTPELLAAPEPAPPPAPAEPAPAPAEPEVAPQIDPEQEAAMAEIPPTIDPDAAPPPPPPPTDDPDNEKPKRIRRPSQRLGRPSDRIEREGAQPDHGLVWLFLAFVLVVGAGFGARAATAPDSATRARIALARAHLALVKDRDYKKADESLAAAREAAQGNAPLLAEIASLEDEERERRVDEYRDARRKGTWAIQSPRLVEGTDLECLHAFDVAKRDQVGDAKVWQRIGTDCLHAGFPQEAAEALATAAQKDSSFQKDKELGARAADLGAFLPAGTYPKTTLKKPLYVGANPVTREDYAHWLDVAVHASAPHAKCSPKEPPNKDHAPQGWDAAVAIVMRDRRPATGVDYWDAVACAHGLGGRLPSPGELLAAAAGRSARPHPWGAHAFSPAFANADNAFEGKLLPVGSLYGGASPCGAYDLLGNAEEWCQAENDDAPQAPVFGGNATTAGDKLSLEGEPATAPVAERAPLRGFRVVLDLD